MPPTPRPKDYLDLIADRWALLIVGSYNGLQPQRFTGIKRAVRGISQRMLKLTLDRLQEAGIVERQVMGVQHVEYPLTPRGVSLKKALGPLFDWAWSQRGELWPSGSEPPV